MKYIVLKGINENGGTIIEKEFPFIFPQELIHQDVAKRMQHLLMMEHEYEGIEVVSAGECNLFGNKINCSGESTTLNVKSREEIDDLLITTYNYNHGYL